jgi:hypothetical protein
MFNQCAPCSTRAGVARVGSSLTQHGVLAGVVRAAGGTCSVLNADDRYGCVHDLPSQNLVPCFFFMVMLTFGVVEDATNEDDVEEI